jgi:hypothetical protein
MKFIVKTDFYRTSQLADVEIVDACTGAGKQSPHANHFHAGAIIEIGKSVNESELQTAKKDSNEVKQLIAQLRYAGRIGDASDKDVVKRVEEDVAVENKRLARQKAAAERTDSSDLGDKLTAAIAKLLEGKLAPAK